MEQDTNTNLVELYAGTVVSMYQNVSHTYEQNIEMIKDCEDELRDLEHEMELAPDKNAGEGYKLYKEMREVRRKRRFAKEENELLKDLYECLKANEAFKNRMTQIQGTARKIYNTQINRQYMPRIRTDLTITSVQAEKTRPFEDMISDWKRNKARVNKDGKLVRR